jgi:hypothetical protein
MQHVKPADLVFLHERLVDGTRRVLAEPEREADLEGDVCAKRTSREDGDRLRLALAGDDVRLPLVRVDGGSALPLQLRQAAQVRAMGMREHDSLEIRD